VEQAVTPAVARADAPAFSKGYRAWLLTLLAVTNALNLADRQCIAVVSQAIKVDIKLADWQLGMIQGIGFAAFYSFFGLLLARLSERASRTKIIATCLGLFGLMSALCGTATNSWRLLLFRMGVGVGDGGFGPPVASLVGDHYPPERRASAMSMIWLGAPAGVVCGSMLGGWMAQNVSWRAAFVIIGVSGVLVSVIAFLTLREPRRGMSDPGGIAAAATPPPLLQVLRFLLSKPSMRHLLLGCGLAAVAMNGIGQSLAQFLIRNYHIGFAEAGRVVSVIAGFAMASGLVLGGFGVDWAGRIDKRWYVWGPAITLVLAAPLFATGFAQSAMLGAIVYLILAHVVLFVYYTPSLALAQNMVGADMRATSGFLVGAVLAIIGIGLGPTLALSLSDVYAAHAFTLGHYTTLCPHGLPPADAVAELASACRDASATGLRHSLMTTSLITLWAAVHYFLAARTLRQDLETRYSR
jgi:predicted MFS family arabinose efflux permease